MISPQLPLRSLGRGVLLSRSTNQTITNSVETVVAFDTITKNDFGACVDLVVDNTKIIIPLPGWYYIWAKAQWVTNITGQKYMAIKLNSTAGGGSNVNYIATRFSGTNDGDPGYVNVAGVFSFKQFDYIQFYVRHDEAAPHDITAVPTFGAVLIGAF